MEQKQSRFANARHHAASFLKKQGFFVVIGLCAVCAGIAATVALVPRESETLPTPTPATNEAGVNMGETLQNATTPTLTPIPTLAPTPTPEQSAAPVSAPKTTAKAAPPVEGAVIWGYAADTLLYSKTLDQWTTHEGVDIAAKLGTDIHAIRGGTVQNVFLDDLLGVCILVAHEDGMISLYGNLQDDPSVSKGQPVEAGVVLGKIGDTAVSECALEAHVHFALYKKDVPVDPYAHVLLGTDK